MQKLKQIAAGFLVLALVFGLFGFPVNKRAEAATITVSGTVLWIDGYVYVTGTLANPPADRPTQTNWRNNSLALFRDGVLYTGAGSTPTVTTVNASTWSFTWSNLDSDYTWTVDQSTVTRYSGSISGNSATGYSIVNIAERNLEMNYEMRPDGNDTFFIFGTASNEPYQAAMHVIYYGPGITSQIVFCLEHRNAPPYPNIPRNYAPIDPYVFYGSAPYNLDEETITELITGIIVILQNGYPNMDENNVPVPAVNYAGATGPARYATAAALRWWVRSIVGRSPGTYYTPGNLYDDLDDIVPNTRLLRPRDVNLVTPRTAEQNEYLFEWAFGLYEKAGRQELLQHKVTLTPGNMHLVEDIGGEYYEGTVNVALTNCNRGYYVSDASVAAIRALGGTISPLAGSGNGTITITVPAAAAVGLRSIEIEVFGRDTRASQNFNIYKPATATNVQTVGHFIVTPREVADAEVELEFPVSLTVNKSWSPSVPSGASVTFQLTKGGVDVPGETVTLTGPWTHTWTDLPYATDYSVRETAFAPSTYNSVIGSVTESPAGSGNFVLNVTNTEKTCSLTVNKSWSPSVPSGASVTFQLTKGGVDVPGETVTLTGPWTHTWTDLPYATDYSVRETA
ncbi:MAG: Cna B-type domain-containing protein, partial [Clostridiales bacterium]|nr:Cna B-type domain-containing protein [Clostridiales bacterium]